jgi:hypothetical protein
METGPLTVFSPLLKAWEGYTLNVPYNRYAKPVSAPE